jgi:hypothetical protein
MADISSPYKTENGTVLIELRLHRVQQMFNSLDPAPFLEKDLDAEAEDYIVGSAREFSLATPLRLVLHLPPDPTAEARDVADAVHNYFAYRRDTARRDLHQFLRQGRTSLAIGLAFLIACFSGRELVLTLGQGTFYKILAEGLIIMGWVAMWRPLQIFLYDWWPLRRTGLIHAKLAAIPVEIRPEA